MDDANHEVLRQVPHAEEYAFHPLLEPGELQEGEVSVPDLLAKARKTLGDFDGGVDAIVGYWDFPVSTLVALLNREYGLRGTSLESIVKCEHKYWSRLEQQKVISEHPRFGLVDLDEENPGLPEHMRFPVWLKPVKSYSSELAFGVKNEEEFAKAVEEIRNGISRIGRPFEYILEQIELPREIAEAGGQACLAEESLTGVQCAVEGYVRDGEITVYGALDSIDYPDSSSFLRHQYPSQMPEPVQRRLKDVTKRVIWQIGMNNATFSIEFFYDAQKDEINLLEINPRHSQSHAELFEYVDGVPNHDCMLSLALGREPSLLPGHGTYAVAAKWYHRWFTDGVVRRVPTQEEIAEVEREIPGVKIDVVPEQNELLSDAPEQDSYSYELAHVFVGADSEAEMVDKYNRCLAALPFRVEEPADAK
ncbi:acetyl-CoA carboxylase biotin carboxylase subunit family protein [Streptomyces sp. WMMB 322]|uniref:ATP-grasp domain-containing protein n=1 Tax=Streptomyces sp. WMMB 322 TaxID=1286821 RepID=UPI0006E144CB|nr:ATP-grasp domain-containing protein [Streptomyces sp. WMMB 322]